jgi:hypothetical protein
MVVLVLLEVFDEPDVNNPNERKNGFANTLQCKKGDAPDVGSMDEVTIQDGDDMSDYNGSSNN